jgi:hypothetical protein
MYLNRFHFYADDMGRKIEAHHYCSHITEEFYQCVIYDGNAADARLISVEYIVSERIFKSLPDEEKTLWHSHRHETLSGKVVMPGIPGRWNTPPLPLPSRPMARLVAYVAGRQGIHPAYRHSPVDDGLTADGQLKPEMLQPGTGTSASKPQTCERPART